MYPLCAGESIAATLLHRLAQRCPDEAISTLLARIAQDEGKHATMGWEVLDARLPHCPPDEGLKRRVPAQVARAVVAVEGTGRDLGPTGTRWGLSDRALAASTARYVVATDVFPKLSSRDLWAKRNPPRTDRAKSGELG